MSHMILFTFIIVKIVRIISVGVGHLDLKLKCSMPKVLSKWSGETTASWTFVFTCIFFLIHYLSHRTDQNAQSNNLIPKTNSFIWQSAISMSMELNQCPCVLGTFRFGTIPVHFFIECYYFLCTNLLIHCV